METRHSENIGFVANPWPLQDDRPTLVFIHGSGQDSGFWIHQMKAFEETANAVALDLPGRGASQGSGLDSMTAYAHDVMKFIDRIVAPDPIPAGLSIGGGIVLQLLLDHPGRFEGGILVNTGARLRVKQDIFDLIKTNFREYVNAFCTFALSPKSNTVALKPQIASFTKASAVTTFGDYSACNNFDVMERLAEIQTPVLVLSAEDDFLTPPKYGQYLADNISNAQLANIDAAGHMAPFEKPEAVNQAIEGYLKSLRSG
jgi:pimeloyl-ACP methyl ester carboxylesterase